MTFDPPSRFHYHISYIHTRAPHSNLPTYNFQYKNNQKNKLLMNRFGDRISTTMLDTFLHSILALNCRMLVLK